MCTPTVAGITLYVRILAYTSHVSKWRVVFLLCVPPPILAVFRMEFSVAGYSILTDLSFYACSRVFSLHDHLPFAQVRTRRPMPKVRCMGSSHSWSPHFADDGAWMVDTSGINHLQWSADQPKQVCRCHKIQP